MLFNSYEFIFVFLPVTVLGYFGLIRGGRERLARSWLLLSSLIFYSYWKPVYLPLIVGSVVFNYMVGAAFGDGRLARRLGNKPLLVLGVGANLAVLGWFKYAGFFVDNLNSLLGTDLASMQVELPLAISFFTF
jgi:alginate O-acetyltransferase complex protein AlgI